jgi:hypothetical protein
MPRHIEPALASTKVCTQIPPPEPSSTRENAPSNKAGYVVGGVQKLDPSAQAEFADVRISAGDHA